MTKGAIYYTDFHADPKILEVCLKQLKKSFKGEVVSVSLGKPVDFGKNIVFDLKRGYIAMMRQIIAGLENLTTDYVFFCENDVLYNPSHFDFTPPTNDIFYYNANNYRWEIGSDKAISHDRMIPLSVMCCYRKLALRYYYYRWQKMEEIGMKEFENSQSSVMRKIGFEPGTKKKKRGGLTDDDFDTWYSDEPVIDIRHKGTFSPTKVKLESFKHAPKNWEEININELPLCKLIS